MPPLSYTPYYPIVVAANLRFDDANGVPVTQMFPVASSQALDNPGTGYISLIGSKVSDLLATYQQVSAVLSQYNTRITALETAVTNIQTSGVTFQLYVNGGCLLGNTTVTVPAAVTALMNNSCDYNTVLGTTTALTNAVAAQCTNLNSLPAFSQSGDMSGLSGWFPAPLTIASSFSNLWKSYCDARTGITTALAAVTPACSQVIIAYQAVLNGNLVFNIYFSGYSFIPTGYVDGGSTITVRDTGTGVYTQALNVVTQSTDPAPLVLYTSGSTLSPQSTTYTITLDSIVTNSALGLTCEKTTTAPPISNPASPVPSDTTCCPDIGTYTGTLSSGATALTVVSTLSYTPRYADWEPGNAFTAAQFYPGGSPPYITRTLGGFVLHFSSPTAATGTVLLDCITYR